MLLILACLLAAAAAAPTTLYDQRQQGETNFRSDVSNVVVLITFPKKLKLNDMLSTILNRHSKTRESELQDRSDAHVMEAFIEPSEPYRVEIGGGSSDRAAGGAGGHLEVVIAAAGRRRDGGEPGDSGEYKLIGATEQCGPGRERDPATLTCRAKSKDNVPENSALNDIASQSVSSTS